GSCILSELARRGTAYAMTRRPSGPSDIGWAFDAQDSLVQDLRARKVSVLVHAAWDFSALTAADIHRVNVEGSARLFQLAREAGVRRIVLISSISAFNGARSLYGRAKLEVEADAARHNAIIH